MALPVEYPIAFLFAFVSALISSCAGFGGAILLLPALTALLGLQRALPILACAQLVGNASRAIFGFYTLKTKVIFIFAAGLVPAGIIGTLYLTRGAELIVRPLVATIVCGAALFEAAEVFGLLPAPLKSIRPPEKPGLWFAAAGGLVGLISALGGTAGPLPNAFFLRLNLSPAAYIANEAAAMGLLHLAKFVAFGLADWQHEADIVLMVIVSAAMISGTFAGKQLLHRMPLAKYRKVLALWMLTAAASMFFIAAD